MRLMSSRMRIRRACVAMLFARVMASACVGVLDHMRPLISTRHQVPCLRTVGLLVVTECSNLSEVEAGER